MKRLHHLVQEEEDAEENAKHDKWWDDIYSGLVEKFSEAVKPAIKRDCFSYHWIQTLLESDLHLKAANRMQGFVDLIERYASVRYVEIERELWATKKDLLKFSEEFLEMLSVYKEVYPEQSDRFEFDEKEFECMRFYSASTMQELDWLIHSKTYIDSYIKMI
jgi:hypothetical protein